jgi:hypothetical protein
MLRERLTEGVEVRYQPVRKMPLLCFYVVDGHESQA